MHAPMNWIKTVIRALAASMSARAAAMIMRFAAVCLLPIWLTPAEIGWNAVIMAIVNVAIAVIDFGFGTALIKEKTCSVRMYRSVFTLILAFSLIGAALMIAFSDPVGRFFSFPPVILIISAFAVPFSVLSIVPNALLQRDLRFASLAMRDLIGEAAFGATAIGLAWSGQTWLCVPAALVVQRFARWIVSTASISYSPGFAFCLGDLRKLLSFSLCQFGNITVAQLANRLDTFLLSVFLAPSALGFYAQGQQLSIFPVQSLTGAATNVFFATFAKIQDDPEKIRTLFVKITGILFFVSIAAIGLAYPAMGLIPVIYSPAWQDAVEIARNLCFCIPFFALCALEGILIAIGGERRRLAASIVRMIVMGAGICLLFGVFRAAALPQNVAWIVLASAAAGSAMNFRFIWRKLRLTPKDAVPWIKFALSGVAGAAAGIAITRLFGL